MKSGLVLVAFIIIAMSGLPTEAAPLIIDLENISDYEELLEEASVGNRVKPMKKVNLSEVVLFDETIGLSKEDYKLISARPAGI